MQSTQVCYCDFNYYIGNNQLIVDKLILICLIINAINL